MKATLAAINWSAPPAHPTSWEHLRPLVHYCRRMEGIFLMEVSMSSLSFRSSRPDKWVSPRSHQDASLRYMQHGPVQPMEEPGFFSRLFGQR